MNNLRKNYGSLEEYITHFDILLKENDDLNNELIKVNLRLRESERLKSNFLSNVRNEVNNPLTSSIGLLIALSKKENAKEESKNEFELIIADLKDLAFQLNNIFYASEIESGKVINNPRRSDIVKIIQNSIDELKYQSIKKSIHLIFVSNIENNFISQFDSEIVRVILLNIINNALTFSILGGKIEIGCSLSNSEIHIKVKNTGSNLPDDEIEKIFMPFWQRHAGSEKLHRGHGLGLSITKELLEIIGGKITVKNLADSEIEFTVIFPVEDKHQGTDSFDEILDGNIELF